MNLSPRKRRRGVDNKNVQTDLCEDRVVQELRAQVQDLRLKIKNMNSPSFVVNESEEAGKFYTGLSQRHRAILWDFLGSEEDKNCLKLYKSGKTCGQLRLPIYDQFLLCLIKLRRGMTYKEMRFRFKMKSDLASKIVKTWLQFIFLTMKDMKDEMFIKKNEISRPLPKHFRCNLLRNVRVVIDCTEIFVESSTNYRQQGNIFSNYKHHATIKILIGVSPSGAAIFVSDGFEGSISDKAITQESGFLDFIDQGDVVLADRGFTIAHELAERGAKLIIPPFLHQRKTFTLKEERDTKLIAKARIHVERYNKRLKEFSISVSNGIPKRFSNIKSSYLCMCVFDQFYPSFSKIKLFFRVHSPHPTYVLIVLVNSISANKDREEDKTTFQTFAKVANVALWSTL